MWTICIDVKLLLVVLVFSCFNIRFAGGTVNLIVDTLCQRRRWFHNGGIAEIDHLRRTCNFPICQFSFCRQWRPAKPSTGMSFGFSNFHHGLCMHLNLLQNFGVNRFQSTVRFSQSDLLLTSSDGTVAFCKDKERILLQWFSRQVIQFFLSDFRGLFVHARCTPQQ